MKVPKIEVLPLIADMHAYGYSAASIARAIGVYRTRRVQQLLRDMGLIQAPLKSIDDLPPELRERVDALQLCAIRTDSSRVSRETA